MKKMFAVILVVFLLLSLGACNKSSKLEGKLVDWKNRPVAGVKIAASQVQPLKGYEQFEAITSTDGTFLIKGLFPSALYILKPWSDKWTSRTETIVESAPEGETALLPSPIIIEQVYTKTTPELIADIATGNPGRTSLAGSLVDWMNRPVKGVKIIADEDRFDNTNKIYEVTTKSDGSFLFTNLAPSTRYELTVASDKWNAKTFASASTPNYHGETTTLKEPMVIKQVFTKSNPPLTADIDTGNVGKTILEGKLVDWGNRPVAGVTIVATQEQPVSGYEKFETVTDNDGNFIFSTLIPSSRYKLNLMSDKWNAEISAVADTPQHHGYGIRFNNPVVIKRAFAKNSCNLVGDLVSARLRFAKSSDNVIIDTITNLQWIEGPDNDVDYSSAEKWIANCQIDGGGWRMPTTTELQTIYQKGVDDCIRKRPRVMGMGEVVDLDHAFFKTTAPFVWAKTESESQVAKQFNFNQGREWTSDSGRAYLHRVFGVRSH